jgi:membrane protease YdiL (CAAX protease family)
MQEQSKFGDKILLILYFILTFIFSWSLWFGSGILIRNDTGPIIDNLWLISQIGVFGPSLIAIIITSYKNPHKNRNNILRLLAIYVIVTILGIFITKQNIRDIQDLNLLTVMSLMGSAIGILVYIGLSGRILYCDQIKVDSKSSIAGWTLFSILLFPALFVIAWTIVNIQTDTSFMIHIGGTQNALIVHLLILFSFDIIFGGAFGEEIGWRGFVLPILLSQYSPLKASLILGFFWSLWHLPIDLIHGFGAVGISGIVMRLLFVCPMSIIITWFYLRTQKPILSALLLHASINILPILKFSNYEVSMAVMAIEMMLISLFIVVLDKNFLIKPQNFSPNDRD